MQTGTGQEAHHGHGKASHAAAQLAQQTLEGSSESSAACRSPLLPKVLSILKLWQAFLCGAHGRHALLTDVVCVSLLGQADGFNAVSTDFPVALCCCLLCCLLQCIPLADSTPKTLPQQELKQRTLKYQEISA